MACEPKVFVRAVTPEEGRELQRITKRSEQSIRVRHAIVVMASAQRQPVPLISKLMQVSEGYVREVIHDFNEKGFAALDLNGAGVPAACSSWLTSANSPRCAPSLSTAPITEPRRTGRRHRGLHSLAQPACPAHVTDRLALTPVAIREGHAFADTEFGGKPWFVEHALVPTAVFSTPEIGTVGWPEHLAGEHCGKLHVYKAAFRPLKATLSGRDERMLMKLIVADDSEQGRRLPCAGRGCRRDRADGGDRAAARGDEGGLRRHDGAAPDGGGGARDHAREVGRSD